MQIYNRDYTEKRDFLRMHIDSPVEILLAGEDSPRVGICRDLSGGGMLVDMEMEEASLSMGSPVQVTLASSHGHAPVLQAMATVVRWSQVPGIEADLSGLDVTCNRIGLRLNKILA